jgi:ribosomal protein S18 acetylase RimI-like enzyme
MPDHDLSSGSGARDRPSPFQVTPDRHDEVTRVMCDAFHDYPVMRYVIGRDHDSYEVCLQTLVGYFVQARFLHGDPVLAVEASGVMTAAATLTAPGDRDDPPTLAALRDSVWKQLGEPARLRYVSLCDIWGRFWLRKPHYHVNMIGVLPAYQGRGLARILLDHVHALSKRHPQSLGVSLTTEVLQNVRLYEHLGYRIMDHEDVGPDFETWGLFRAGQRGERPHGTPT